MRLLPVCALAVVTFSSLLAGSYSSPTARCTTVYFLNSIAIDASSGYSGVLYLEAPLNFSIRGLNQTARAVISRGVRHDEGGACLVEVAPGSPLYAYVVYEVRTCSPEFSSSLAVLKWALTDPLALLRHLEGQACDADGKPSEYLGEPPEIVRTAVRMEFDEWLRSFSWYYQVGNASGYQLLVSVYAAWFVYSSGYIEYDASLLPNPLSDVIENRRGDCDDMSRVLVALLWSYGVPALVVHGFVLVPEFSMKTALGTLNYVFEGGGPHAFVIAYAPGYGWLSLDFLAGSLLTHPFVIWGMTTEVEVSGEDVDRLMELHSAVVGRQLMTAMLPGDPRLRDTESLELFINSSLGLGKVSKRTGPAGGQANGSHATGDTYTPPAESAERGAGAPESAAVLPMTALALATAVALAAAFSRRRSPRG